MRVEQYGLSYDRVTEADIELIRYWRNQPHIRATMQFRDYITPKMQAEWFQRINNPHNYYFVISIEEKKIGLINCKEFPGQKNISEGGIFIWEESYWGTPVPVFAALSMLEAIFEVLESGDASVVNVRKENARALEFNKLLGYEIKGESKNSECYQLWLTKEKYMRCSPKLKRAAEIFSSGKSELKIFAAPGPLFSAEVNFALERLKSSDKN
jgi:UDP-4-amino-4,6-dideoxy-N-acetyl-beta-L-altrosamine N-acetyltransferase